MKSSPQIAFRLPTTLRAELVARADKADVTLSRYIVQALAVHCGVVAPALEYTFSRSVAIATRASKKAAKSRRQTRN